MEKRSKSNQSVEKTLQIIEVMARARGPLRLQEISRQSELPPSTTLRMVNTLVQRGYAFQEADTLRYGLTLQLSRIGSMIGAQYDLREYAHPIMEQLSVACGEACCLAIEQDHEVVYVDLVDGPDNMLRIMQYIGKRAPMHCTGIGKLLLLNRTDDQVRALMEQAGMRRFTDRTITTMEALYQELAQIRARGYSTDDEECEIGARCVAAGVYDYTGRIVGGISVSGPATRLTAERIPQIAELVVHAGRAVSSRMGWQPAGGEAWP